VKDLLCLNFKILYLFLSVSFGLILDLMANNLYEIILAIDLVSSGSIHFLYEAYKALYTEEYLIKKMIWKNKIKIKLLNSKTMNLIIYINL